MKTAEQLGERNIIEIIWDHLEKDPKMPIPFGDDVSGIKCENGSLLVVKTDMLVAKTDMPPTMNYSQAARKAVVMNISDLAAKGVRPAGALVSLGLPRSLTEKDISNIGIGLNEGVREYGTFIIGGDINEADDLIISIAIFGFVNEESIILRSGASPGEYIATTGLFGLTACGLKILKEGYSVSEENKQNIINSVLEPHARLKEGIALADTNLVSASIDSSDGLAWSLHELGKASNIGFLIDNLPIAKETLKFAETHDLDPLDLVFHGGEEYEILVTVNPKHWKKVSKNVTRNGGELTKIGVTTSEKKLLVSYKDKIKEIKRRGYEHFRTKRRK